MFDTVTVTKAPPCDVCADAGQDVPAAYDAKTIFGPWGYLCERHWRAFGVGHLGAGLGQRLIVKGGDRE
jgi:hypothetical protein